MLDVVTKLAGNNRGVEEKTKFCILAAKARYRLRHLSNPVHRVNK
jgi:hypothetical protein